MKLEKSVELEELNTLGVKAEAENFAVLSDFGDAKELLTGAAEKPITVLGGGSNILFMSKVPGTVVHNQIKGIKVIDETSETVYIKVGAGENWHDFVSYCVKKGYGGIENLALIPGTVGASPVQNIGAYGVEAKDVITHVHALSLDDGHARTFTRTECEFDYRSSIFKTSLKGKYLITSVIFELKKHPELQTNYGALKGYLEEHAEDSSTWTIKTVFKAVVRIRKSKLPDPAVIGNAGSFFKNPIVNENTYVELLLAHPNVPSYPLPKKQYKIPAGWLVETAGWKGTKRGPIGVHEKQALVITHTGGATGMEIYEFSEDIRKSVKKLFDIELEREVNVVPAAVDNT